jgi:translation initiation factor 1
MSKKEKILLSPNPPGGLGSPFAGLQTQGLPPGEMTPPPAQSQPGKLRRGRVVLRRETAHRGGKTVIVVHDFAPSIPLSLIEELARRLRNACGCGGTIRQRAIELQGDQPAKIRAFLEAEGFQVAGVK